MPPIGFGTFKVPAEETEGIVSEAIGHGYRLIDTAQGYGNERGVGRAVARSGIAREELFLTTKVSNDAHGRVASKDAVRRSAEALEAEQIDLVLIHWPRPLQGLAAETWDALCELKTEGIVREIGLSNFTGRHLERILAHSAELPAVNQIECHPFYAQTAQRRRHEQLGIVTQSSSALGRGGDLLSAPAVVEVAGEHGVAPAQVVLRWHLQNGLVPLVKSTSPERMRQNLDVFGFELTTQQLARLASLDGDGRRGPDPDYFPDEEPERYGQHKEKEQIR